MIKIEVTGNSIPEVADKLIAIGRSLQQSNGVALFSAPHPANDGVNVPDDVSPAALKEVEVEVAEAASVDPTPEPTPPSDATPAPAAPELDYNRDVRAVALKVVEKCGKPVMQEILLRFGVTNASFLPPEQFPELISAMNAALAR